MFEKFLSSNSADFRQRYEGTWGFYKNEKGTRMLAQLTSINEETCTFTDAKGVEYSLNADSEKDIGFEFIPPKSQFYNTSTGALLVLRGAARQFQRGISTRNISIMKLVLGGMVNERVGFPTLDKIYMNAVPAKEALVNFINGKQLSVAISNHFALEAKGGIYLYADLVGAYTFDKDRKAYMVKLKEPSLWSTEIGDAFKALDTSVEIT